MFYLIGTGFKTLDISLGAIDVAKMCDKLYAEDYTMKYDFKELSKIIGKEITILNRAQVEEEMVFLNEAKKENIALLVPGDPLTATTHSSILLTSKE